VAGDQRVGKILVRSDERDAIPLEQGGFRIMRAQGLALEH
jgi:hypothetical protein